jgi:hypothetical protein
MLRLTGKVFRRWIKSHPACTGFTLCLPGSPKVNAGGACGAWLPGRELVRISASTIASREKWPLLAGGQTPTRHHQEVICARTRNAFAGTTFDELVQWMVQDASLGR